jgi:hypothetical protein
LVDPSEADTPLRIQTGSGVKGVSTDTLGGLTANVETNQQNVELILYEDTDGDGEPENTETINLQGGTNSYQLNNIQGNTTYEYWIELQFDNPEIQKTAEVKNITLKF